MISRVADHCFWLGRYLERAESTARLLHVTLTQSLDNELPAEASWMPLVIVSGEEKHFIDRFGKEGASNGELVQRYLSWDEANLVSIYSSICAARENARAIRDVISIESWEALNALYLWLKNGEGERSYQKSRHEFFQHIREGAALLLGLFDQTMLRDEPLDFIWLGVLLERAGQTARVLDVHYHAHTRAESHRVVETALWLNLLRACSGFEPFLKANRGRVSGEAIAKFLIFEPRFPRSIRASVRGARARLTEMLPPGQNGVPGREALARLCALDEWLDARQGEPQGSAIHGWLTYVVNESSEICVTLGRELFSGGISPAPKSDAQ